MVVEAMILGEGILSLRSIQTFPLLARRCKMKSSGSRTVGC